MHQIITNPRQAGEILRRRRMSRKLSQRALAAKLGVSQNRLSVLESAPAGLALDRLIALANLLGLELVLRDKSGDADGPAAW